MLRFETKGTHERTEQWLKALSDGSIYSKLSSLAEQGRLALSAATPKDSGITAASWTYTLTVKGSDCTIEWRNTHIVNGAPIALLLQYGHGTGTGGYVVGQDYINPAIKPVFDRILVEVERAVRA